MKHYYSVMTRHIIGVKWTSFKKVAETVMTSSQSFKPHMHIFYCGLLDCVDELNLDRRHQREMDKVVMQMEEELKRAEPSDLLYELCDTLFPEDFQRMLREHRPKSYKEVEDESQQKDELIKQIRQQNQHLTSELEKAKDVLQQMILSSIPIEEIDAELIKYPPATAFDLLRELNNSVVLSVLPAWREHYPYLLEKYRNRLFEPIDEQRDLTSAMKKVAKQYAEKVFGKHRKSILSPSDRRLWYIGGHSKGANLAAYAACQLPDEILKKVEKVFVLDGPGFSPDVVPPETVERIYSKAERIIPEYCIIGRLMEIPFPNTKIIQSSNDGAMQATR